MVMSDADNKIERKKKNSQKYLKDYSEDVQLYMDYLAKNYDKIRTYFISQQIGNAIIEDLEDIFNDTILTCRTAIERYGIKDKSEQGMMNYIYKSFAVNVRRDKEYSHKKYKSDVEDISYEQERFNENEISTIEKVKQQMYNDFSIMYILSYLEDKVDSTTFYCFRLKYLLDITYQELKSITKVKDARQRCLYAKNILKENLTKKDIEKAFDSFYDERICL